MITKPRRPNGKTRERIAHLHQQHPNWTLERYARKLGLSHTAVHYHLVDIKAKYRRPDQSAPRQARRQTVADPYGQVIFNRSRR